MKPITPALQNLFKGRQYNRCGIYSISLVNGGSLYYSSGDVDIIWGGHTYTSGHQTGPYFDRTSNKAKLHQKIGVAVDTLSFDVIPKQAKVQGIPFLQAVKEGVFDGASLVYSGAYWPTGTSAIAGQYAPLVAPTGVIDKFEGLVAEVDMGRSLATFTVNSHLDLLSQNMPRNLYQSGCTNTLYDASCTLNQASFLTTGTVQSGSTALVIEANLSASLASGYFNLGVLTFTSGANNGISRTVGLHTFGSPVVITLISPFPNTPFPGDTFDIFPGCDKSLSQCSQRFNNIQNFRGFPFIPTAETAI